MPPRKIKIEDLRRFVFVSDPQVSPDGSQVAFVHTKIDYRARGLGPGFGRPSGLIMPSGTLRKV